MRNLITYISTAAFPVPNAVNPMNEPSMSSLLELIFYETGQSSKHYNK